MKYLVTVGTTTFDTLIKFLDCECREYEFVFQIANGTYQPKNNCYFRFSPTMWEDYNGYAVITHAGAGSVYSLLEKGEKFIAIANTERTDKHQLDLCGYLASNNLALVGQDFGHLKSLLEVRALEQYTPIPYEKEDFFLGDYINKLIEG